jgi:hypothetical protein
MIFKRKKEKVFGLKVTNDDLVTEKVNDMLLNIGVKRQSSETDQDQQDHYIYHS